VTSITTAPVAIGNSISGSTALTLPLKNGNRAVGRDFAFSIKASVAAANDWTLVGGFPVTPSCLQASVLRSYAQMYSKFKVNRLHVHYITSSPTSQAGDIVLYYERDRMGPMVDSTNQGFLPFMLSDSHTILGPQWQNHTMVVTPSDGFNNTDYGVNSDLNEDSCGSVFVFSKTNAASSPGYVIIDYDISFTELCINPRAGILPISRAKWFSSCIGKTAVAVTAGTTVFEPVIQGVDISGVNAAGPTGLAAGDIYKIIIDVTNSTVSGTNAAWTNVNTSNLLEYSTSGSNFLTTTIDDGTTFYGMMISPTLMRLYLTLSNAQTDTNFCYYAATATVTFNLCISMSYVGSKGINNQASY
jgi:hypothetical protein